MDVSLRDWFKKINTYFSRTKFAEFSIWNIGLGTVFVVQAVLLLILGKSHSLPITTNYLSKDVLTSMAAGHTVLVATTRQLTTVNLKILVALILLIAGVAHLLSGTYWRPFYERNLQKGANPIRWIEYCLGTGLLIVVIALVTGVSDISSLIILFLLLAIANLCGLAMEQFNQGRRKLNWLGYIMGSISGAGAWLVLAIYSLGAINYGSGVSGYVYAVLISIFVLFIGFAVKYKTIGQWKNYLYVEKIYLLLELATLTALAWQIFAGALRS
jgi:hypothetical protein